MKKKIKLKDLTSLFNGFTEIMKLEMSFKAVYKLNKIYNVINSEFEDMEKVRLKILDKYAEKDEKDNIKIAKNEKGVSEAIIKADKRTEFNGEIARLFTTEIEVEFMPLQYEDFDKEDRLKGSHMFYLAKFMEEPEKEGEDNA